MIKKEVVFQVAYLGILIVQSQEGLREIRSHGRRGVLRRKVQMGMRASTGMRGMRKGGACNHDTEKKGVICPVIQPKEAELS